MRRPSVDKSSALSPFDHEVTCFSSGGFFKFHEILYVGVATSQTDLTQHSYHGIITSKNITGFCFSVKNNNRFF